MDACANCEHGEDVHYGGVVGEMLDDDEDSGCHVCDDVGGSCPGFTPPEHGEDVPL